MKIRLILLVSAAILSPVSAMAQKAMPTCSDAMVHEDEDIRVRKLAFDNAIATNDDDRILSTVWTVMNVAKRRADDLTKSRSKETDCSLLLERYSQELKYYQTELEKRKAEVERGDGK